ncbi:MAG: right-handed parallel beta-helix repeat-containing protein [Thermoleophilaceae bacterium]
MRRLIPGLALLVAMALPAIASGHAERPSYFPNFNTETQEFEPITGEVPTYRSRGPSRVVCDGGRKATAERIREVFKGSSRRTRRLRDKRLAINRRCRHKTIQSAVNAADSGDRILIMPGTYREAPSREEPEPDPACNELYVESENGTRVASYEYQRACPNAQNLIAVIGDGPDADRACDDRCSLQIEGLGLEPADVFIEGERAKLNVIRADRADGIYLKNFEVEKSDFNNIYVLETNGFRIDEVVSHDSREYGVLSFASDNGLYENIEAYRNGDSGIYPGSGPEGHCERYGIEIRNSDSHDNAIGYSGTAGNGVWAHDNKFHHNSAGITTDSFASGHPGMPQDCAKWENNEIYSNNKDLYNAEMDAYCKRPVEERDDPEKVCPTFQTPVGTGILIAGGNGNIARGNHIYDNWRNGIMLLYVPALLRGSDSTGQSENDSGNQFDTSHGNSFADNRMGTRPDGTRDPNGLDFWWDEEGAGNCWGANEGAGGGEIESDPASLPACPEGSAFSTGNPVKSASQATCATWNPVDNTDPPGCDWFTQPPEPE